MAGKTHPLINILINEYIDDDIQSCINKEAED